MSIINYSATLVRIGKQMSEPVYVNGVKTEDTKTYTNVLVESNGKQEKAIVWQKSLDNSMFDMEIGDTLDILVDTWTSEKGNTYKTLTAFPASGKSILIDAAEAAAIEKAKAAAQAAREKAAAAQDDL